MKHIITSIILLNCYLLHAQKTYVPDNNFEQALIDLGYDNALDDSVLTANISGITSLDVGNNEISDLTGIEAFTSLTNLYCNYNNLTSIDISSNTALITLMLLYNNDLDSLDVSNNTALTTLRVGSDQLTSLDVSNNTALTDLYCWCELTAFDVSANTALTYLDVQDNDLDSLDVSNNTALTELRLYKNNLTSLDVSNNTALINLYCSDNNLTSLDVSNNTSLMSLGCSNNDLTVLDVSNNTALTQLYCDNISLTSLDLSSNTALTLFYCQDNELTYLNMRNGITDALTTFDATDNTSLSCIETLDPDYATANWTYANGNIDEGVLFSETCSPGCTDPYAGNYDSTAAIDDGSCTNYPDNGEYYLSFDGVDDGVTINDNQSLDLTTASITAWVKSTTNDSLWQTFYPKDRIRTNLMGFF